MARYSLVFLVFAIICAIFGFTGIMPDNHDWIAKVAFYAFLGVFVISLIIGVLNGRREEERGDEDEFDPYHNDEFPHGY